MEQNKDYGQLIEALDELDDPRSAQRVRYPLVEIVFLTVVAVLSGSSDWEEIVDFGQEKLGWLRGHLPYANGIPAHDTINRVMGMIDCRAFERIFLSWATMGIRLSEGVVINLDGKKLRSSATKLEQQTAHVDGGKSAVHVVEAWCSEHEMCLAQYKVANKSNEIKAIPVLLDWLEIKGSIVTIDAMGCQRDIATKIRSKEADYVFGLKANQEGLFLGVSEAFDALGANISGTCLDHREEKGHGRQEKRTCRTLPIGSLPEWTLADEWTGMKCAIEIQSERLVIASGQVSKEKRYYISSLDCGAVRFNQIIRGHWAIENQLHWAMDVQFGEDASTKRSRNSAENFALIRRIALNMLKTYPEKISVGRKMSKCAISDTYRQTIIEFARTRESSEMPPDT